MQRISVDLPEPEGPQMTISSPLATVRSMFFSAWKAPNHLSTPSIRTATPPSAPGESASNSPGLAFIARNRCTVRLLLLENRRHRLAEPFLIDLVELPVAFDLLDELVDAGEQLLLARLHGDALHLARK